MIELRHRVLESCRAALRTARRLSVSLGTSLVAALLAALPGSLSHAQTEGAPDVMSMFRSMGDDQQQQILRQLGMGEGAGNANQLAAQGQSAEQLQQLQTQRQRQQREQRQELEARLPVLQSQDSVVIEADVQPLPPRPADTAEMVYESLISGTSLAAPQAFGASAGVQAQSGQSISPQLQQLQQQVLQQGTTGAQTTAPQAAAQGEPQNQSAPAPGANPLSALPALQSGQAPQLPQGWEMGPPNLLTAPDPQRLAQLAALIRSRNPYQLSREGLLILPGFPAIAVGGLTEGQATLRLEVDPALRGLYFRVTKLPLNKTGIEGLKPFGYDLFSGTASTFAPVTNIPVPAEYVVGAGDVLDVELYGNQDRFYTLTVQPDGTVSFPELGPISVAGQRFAAVKDSLEGRVARQMIGVKANVTMGTTRSIRVFVLGEAQMPGTYTVSGLATITSALYAAGGVKRIGSLRNIELKRQGQIVRRLDLYDLLIRGDTSDDSRLLPGDAIFIPPVGRTVSVQGEVHRPAIYEIKNESNVADLVQLAGGLTPEAEPVAMLSRIDAQQQRIVLRTDLASPEARSLQLRNGDALLVTSVLPTLDSGVVLQGHLYTPQTVAYRPGLRLTNVIHSVDELRPDADLHYVLIRRELPPDRRVTAFSADLAAALARPGGSADVILMPRDRVIVFDLQSGRDRIIQPLLTELQVESRFGEPAQVVRVDGRVKVPGEYPLEPHMHLIDLIRAGGSLAESAYGGQAELARYTVLNGQERQTDLIRIDLAAVMRGDPSANIELKAFDSLSIKELSLWSDQEQVTLRGQVRFPGVYAIRQGETLRSVLQRAGGLTAYAFPEGAVFLRVELRQREQVELDLLAQRTQADITAMALEATTAATVNGQGGGAGASALAVGQSLLTQLRATRAVGRLVIDLPLLMRQPDGSPDDVVLRNGDQLLVPRFEQEVTVIGEVQSVTSHLYHPQLTRDDYIQQSGGFTNRADTGRIYIVRANGSVVASHPWHFFRAGSDSVRIHPGDTIVVPMNTEKLPPLPEWQAITTILYNLAIGAAAIHAVGV